MKSFVLLVWILASLAGGYSFWDNGMLPDKAQLTADKFVNSTISSQFRLEARIRNLTIKIPLEAAGHDYGQSLNVGPIAQAVFMSYNTGSSWSAYKIDISDSDTTFVNAVQQDYFCSGVAKAVGKQLDMYGTTLGTSSRTECNLYISW